MSAQLDLWTALPPPAPGLRRLSTGELVRPVATGYFNTTHETGEQLRTARATAAHQDALVLRIFESSGRGKSLGPSQVHERGVALGERWILTSVRRSMTNLSAGDSPRLRKTDTKRAGQYGRSECCWELI